MRAHAGSQPGPVTLGAHDVALLTYTSGTTGDPKGAMNTHGNGAETTPEALTEFCRGQLAAYKYPRRIEILPDLPKTPTGKLLRRELRDRAASA